MIKPLRAMLLFVIWKVSCEPTCKYLKKEDEFLKKILEEEKNISPNKPIFKFDERGDKIFVDEDKIKNICSSTDKSYTKKEAHLFNFLGAGTFGTVLAVKIDKKEWAVKIISFKKHFINNFSNFYDDSETKNGINQMFLQNEDNLKFFENINKILENNTIQTNPSNQSKKKPNF